MAYNPIRWDNINAPTFASANKAYSEGAKSLAGAFTGFGTDVLDPRDAEVIKRNTDRGIAEMFKETDPLKFASAADAIQQNAGNRFDMGAFLDARSTRQNELFNIAKNRRAETFNANFRDVYGELQSGIRDGSISNEAEAANLLADRLQPQTPEEAAYIRNIPAELFKPTMDQEAAAALAKEQRENEQAIALENLKQRGKYAQSNNIKDYLGDIYKDDPTDNYNLRMQDWASKFKARGNLFRWTEGEIKGPNGEKIGGGEMKATNSEVLAAIDQTIREENKGTIFDPDLPLDKFKQNLWSLLQNRPVTADTESDQTPQERANAASGTDAIFKAR